jgi:predicted RNA binding protein YcfA (HicA-like mRNA interferase family)
MNCSSTEIIKGLSKYGVVPVGGKESHTTFRYETADTGEDRTVTVPQADPIPMGRDTTVPIKRARTTPTSSVSGSTTSCESYSFA